MVGFAARRLLRIVVTVWAAATFVFVMLRLAGDPVTALIPSDLPQDIIDIYRARYGFDQSFAAQYLAYLGNLLRGDFGFSFRTNGPALDLVLDRLPATGAVIIAPPLKIVHGSGSPVRVLALVETT